MSKLKIKKRTVKWRPMRFQPPEPAIWDGTRGSWKRRLKTDLYYKYTSLCSKSHDSRAVSESFDKLANRLNAEQAMLSLCPDYFALFEPLTRAHATETEIMQAKKNLIKARYPKFYKEVFEDAAETETEEL